MVCDRESLSGVLPDKIRRFSFEHPPGAGVRLVSLQVPGGDGLLPAFVPREIDIRNEKGSMLSKKGKLYCGVALQYRRWAL
jgi:hypothetical protein